MSAVKSTPRKARRATKCLCGCGQAPSSSCRERKAECRGCGYVVRVTRTWIAKGLPVCSCGERFECRCLEDRVVAGDELAYQGLCDRLAMPRSTGRRTNTHDNRVSRAIPAGYVTADAMPF